MRRGVFHDGSRVRLVRLVVGDLAVDDLDVAMGATRELRVVRDHEHGRAHAIDLLWSCTNKFDVVLTADVRKLSIF